ncbi:TPA: hypothetical protein ACH3X3_003311 [Trebouxia sp. C0006]
MQRLVFCSWRLLLQLNVALTFVSRAAAADIYEQHLALNNLYDALNGTAWGSNTGWGGAPSNTTATYCTWKGVYCCYVASSPGCMPANSLYLATCSTPCAVLGLSLANNNLVGQIADSDGDIWDALEAIEFLNLQGNSLSGSIPVSLAQLPILVGVSLQANMLTGSIPPDLFASLRTEIVLAQNLLVGTIPDMSSMTDLVLFDLSSNQLQGPLPALWASSSSLAYFSVQTNMLTGSIPVSNLAGRYLDGLIEIDFRGNMLTGGLSASLARLPIVSLNVGYNQFSGSFNSLLGNCEYIVSFQADGNMLSGPLPANMASLGLMVVTLHDNQLTGTIPSSWVKQGLMRQLDLSDNIGLTGTIPDSLGNWTALEVLTLANTSLMGTTVNINDQLLPSFLALSAALSSVSGVDNLACPVVEANMSMLPVPMQVSLDPAYYDYQGCTCYSTYTFQKVNGTSLCVAALVNNCESISITLLVVVPALVVFFVVLDAVGRLRRGSYKKFVLRWIKHKGAPGTGADITLVSTDVEGSTELWEWDREVMDQAIDVHDHVIRTQLGKYNGYEVTTEGDAFLLAFHEASDAIAWSAATQQALLVAKWPVELQYHNKSCIRQMAQLLPEAAASSERAPHVAFQEKAALQGQPFEAAFCEGGVPSAGEGESGLQRDDTRAGEVDDQDQEAAEHMSLTVKMPAVADAHYIELQDVAAKSIAFRGLSVRMGMATGKVTQTSVHPLTRRTVYHGPLVQLVETIVGLAHGGQVICDSATFTAMIPVLHETAQRVPAEPNYTAMGDANHRQNRPFSPFTLAERSQRVASEMGNRRTPSCQTSMGRPQSPDRLMSPPSGLSVRAETFAQRLSSYMPLISATAQHLSFAAPKPQKDDSAQKELESRSLMVMDMGQHVVQDYAQPLTLHQIMVSGLEDRARTFPALSTAKQLSPGYFDAPGTKQAALGTAWGQGIKTELPVVTLVFSAVDGLKAMRAQEEVAAEHGMTLYRDVIRRLLRSTEGYECQEAEGNFMLVFHCPMRAVQFCLQVQEEMLKVHWREDVLTLPHCQAQVGGRHGLIFIGPRIKMGIYEGIPTRIAPHTTTGSADYFGPLVNRAARFCNGAAHGGQVVGPTSIIPGLLQAWGCEATPEGLGPATFIQVPVGHAQPRQEDNIGALDGALMDPTRAAGSARPSRSPSGSGKLSLQGTIPSLHVQQNLSYSFGDRNGPQTPQSAIPAGAFPSPEASPVPSPTVATEISLSAISSFQNPIYGFAADPQKLAASWVTNQHYGEAANQGQASGATGPAWQLAGPNSTPNPSLRGALYMHRKSSTMARHLKKTSWRSLSAKPSLVLALNRENDFGVAGSNNSALALLPVEEVNEVNEHESDAASAMMLLSPRRHTMRSLLNDPVAQPDLSAELPVDAAEQMHVGGSGALLQSVQQQDRDSAVSVSSVGSAGSVRGNDPSLEALSEVHISHIGQMRFKGVQDPQSVVQFCTAHLAARQFPQQPPSAKAELVKPGQGLQYIVVMKDMSMVPPS